jgi:hypothetical protein
MNSVDARDDSLSRAKGQFSFEWKREAPISWRLIFFLGISFTAHAFCFYLFQVVYPPSERFSPSPSRITFLSPNDAASQAMLWEIEDRVVFIRSAEGESVSRNPLNDIGIEFRPSFAEHELKLKRMPLPAVEGADLDPLSTFGPLLPPLSGTNSTLSSAAQSGDKAIPSIEPGPGLSDRPIVSSGNWNWAENNADNLGGREVMLMLGIDAEGRPEHVLMHSGIGEELDTQILTSSRNIRFESAPGADLQWGKVLLRW